MPRPKISVIVPAYNEAKSIGFCLTSLQNQDYRQPYEIIVVDNNSTDATSRVSQKFNVQIVREKKPGPAAARNAGAKISRAPILAFTDADSIVPQNWLSSIDKAFTAQPHLCAFVGNFQFKRSNKLLNTITPLALSLADQINKLFTGCLGFRGANFAIKKHVFDRVGGFNPKFLSLEDLELGIRVGKIGQIGYLHHPQVMTSDRRFRQGFNKFLKEFIPIYISVAFLKKPSKKNFPNIRC